MSFDVRPHEYVVAGPGTLATPTGSTLHTSSVTDPVTNLVNGNVYNSLLCESFYIAERTMTGSAAFNRFAVGYRLYSDFSAYTNSAGNTVPMVWDLNINAQAGVRVLDSDPVSDGPVAMSVWLHTGTKADDPDRISGGRAVMLGQGHGFFEAAFAAPTTDESVCSVGINFNKSVVVYPSFLAFSPLPLAIGVVISAPPNRSVHVDGLAGDVSGRLYSGVQKVFDPAQQ